MSSSEQRWNVSLQIDIPHISLMTRCNLVSSFRYQCQSLRKAFHFKDVQQMCGTRVANGRGVIEAFAMELVVMTGMLRTAGFGWPQGHASKSRSGNAIDLTSVHVTISFLEQTIAQETRFGGDPGCSPGWSWDSNDLAPVKSWFSQLSKIRPR